MLPSLLLKVFATFVAATGTGLGAPIATLISGESQVLINWVAPSQPINGVDIEESVDSGVNWTTVTKLPPTSTHIRVQGLIDGKNYYFRVRWIWPDNSLGIPSTTMVGVPINNPTAPSGLIATASDTQVALNWDQTTQKSIIGYEVEQSTDGGSTWKVVTSSTGSSSSGYLINGLTPGTSYTFRIKALAFGGGQSDYSDLAIVKIPEPHTTGFALRYSIKLSKITLTWDTPTDLSDVQSYQVNASGDGGANWFTVASTPGGINTAVVPYVIGGSTYQVIATSSSGLTSNSNVELIQTNSIPDPRTTATFDPGAQSGGSATQPPVDTPTPTPTPSDSATTSPVASKSSSLPIIPIAVALVVIGSGAWLIIGARNKGSKKRPKSRPKPKRKPAKKKAKKK
jgi:hypothetical protein